MTKMFAPDKYSNLRGLLSGAVPADQIFSCPGSSMNPSFAPFQSFDAEPTSFECLEKLTASNKASASTSLASAASTSASSGSMQLFSAPPKLASRDKQHSSLSAIADKLWQQKQTKDSAVAGSSNSSKAEEVSKNALQDCVVSSSSSPAPLTFECNAREAQKLWYRCAACNEIIKDIRGHVMIIHYGYKPYVCPICCISSVPGITFRFGRLSDYRRHAKIYHSDDDEAAMFNRHLQPANEQRDLNVEEQIANTLRNCVPMCSSTGPEAVGISISVDTNCQISILQQAISPSTTKSPATTPASSLSSSASSPKQQQSQLSATQLNSIDFSPALIDSKTSRPSRKRKQKSALQAEDHLRSSAGLISAANCDEMNDQNSSELSTLAKSDAVSINKLSKHNDSSFYTNILCLICKEWVCSRNRYLHIESHLQYRPYSCSACGYDNRKQIFISLHIRKSHGGNATSIYRPNKELEHRAWTLAQECLEYTRKFLLEEGNLPEDANALDVLPVCLNNANGKRVAEEEADLVRQSDGFRPKIFNSNRAEKNSHIEQSRKLGQLPDLLSQLSNAEAQCQICMHHVVKLPAQNLEEHARTHLSTASYECPVPECNTSHCCRSFMCRHMKEVHGFWRGVTDKLRYSTSLADEFFEKLYLCFPETYDDATVLKMKSRFLNNHASHQHKTPLQFTRSADSSSSSAFECETNSSSSDFVEEFEADFEQCDDGLLACAGNNKAVTEEDDGKASCLSCQFGLWLSPGDDQTDNPQCISCTVANSWLPPNTITIACVLCGQSVKQYQHLLEYHALQHMKQQPFACVNCDEFSHFDAELIEEHSQLTHKLAGCGVVVNWTDVAEMKAAWRSLVVQCFET